MNEDAELREARANLSGAQRGTGTRREASAARTSEDARTSVDAHTSRIGSHQLRARCRHQDQKINTAGLRKPQKVLEEQLKERKRSEGVNQRDKQNS